MLNVCFDAMRCGLRSLFFFFNRCRTRRMKRFLIVNLKKCVRAALCEVIANLAHHAHDSNKIFGKVSTTNND